MSHLSPDDLIDALEPEAAPHVAAHLADCESCRREVEDLRATLETVKDVDVPEPAPFFWPRFTVHVAEAASAVPARPRTWPATALGVTWLRALAAAAVIVVVASVTVFWKGGSPVKPLGPAASIGPTTQTLPDGPDPAAPEEESPWELVADANAGMDWDAVADAGLDPALGSADRAVLQLSEGERSELARLLRAELAGSL